MNKKKNSKKVIIIVLIAVGFVLAELAVFLVTFNLSSGNKDSVPAVNIISQTTTDPTENTDASAPKKTGTQNTGENTEAETATETPTAETSPTTSSAETTNPPQPTTPEKMVSALQSAGYSINDITAEQLIVVQSYGNSAEINMYSRDNSGKWSDLALASYGYVGSNGVDSKSMEGDYKTPYGLFSIGDMFYIDSMPQTGLNSFQITSDTYWVDDPASAYYNQRVEGTENMDWTSAEHMISY